MALGLGCRLATGRSKHIQGCNPGRAVVQGFAVRRHRPGNLVNNNVRTRSGEGTRHTTYGIQAVGLDDGVSRSGSFDVHSHCGNFNDERLHDAAFDIEAGEDLRLLFAYEARDRHGVSGEGSAGRGTRTTRRGSCSKKPEWKPRLSHESRGMLVRHRPGTRLIRVNPSGRNSDMSH